MEDDEKIDTDDSSESSESPHHSNSDSDTDMDLAEEEEGPMQTLENVNRQLKETPYEYELHILKIDILKFMGDLENLRAAREDLSKIYPLSPKIWLAWIKDECTLAVSPEEKLCVTRLFERAVADYVSVEIWNEYIQFSLEGAVTDADIERCRAVFERAVNAVGHHYRLGHLIWDSYKEFEYEIYKVDKEKSKYLSVSSRQVAIPIMGIEGAFKRLKETGSIDVDTANSYIKALAIRGNFEMWEADLECPDDSSKVSTFKQYIQGAEEFGPKITISVYERLICDCPLDSSVWIQYLHYLLRISVDKDVVLAVGERATRNCPWELAVWTTVFEVIEKLAGTVAQMKVVLEKALPYFTTGELAACLWLKYVEFLRRRISYDSINKADLDLFMKTCRAAEDHLLQLLFEPNEHISELLMYRVRVQAHCDKSMLAARDLWNEILNRGYGRQFHEWVQYYSMEIRYGTSKTTRKCLEKGSKIVQDLPRKVFDLWRNFERDFGDLTTMKRCENNFKQWISSNQDRNGGRSNPDRMKSKRGHDSGFDGKLIKKRKISGVQNPQYKGNSESAVPDDVKDSQQVFLSNLAYSAGVEEVQGFLKDCGKIISVRLVRDYKGKSKGFAYVSFDSEDSVAKALLKDREPLLGRPTFVSKCKPKSDKVSEPLEKNISDQSKLFVKGLPKSKTEEEIKEIFSKYGGIEEVRVMKDQHGVSKGMAHVAFVDDESGSVALSQANGMDVDGSKISVSISKSPVKHSSMRDAKDVIPEKNFRRTQKPFIFVPRAVRSQVKNEKDVKT